MLGIEQQDAEHFFAQGAESRAEVLEDLGTAAEDTATVHSMLQGTAPELERRHQRGARRDSDPALARELGERHPSHALSAAERLQQSPAEVDGGLAANPPAPEHQRDELGIGKRLHAAFEQTLSWPLRCRPIHDPPRHAHTHAAKGGDATLLLGGGRVKNLRALLLLVRLTRGFADPLLASYEEIG